MLATQGLAAILDELALVGSVPLGEDFCSTPQPNECTSNGSVSLMTLHASKGLEFSTVFIAGMVRVDINLLHCLFSTNHLHLPNANKAVCLFSKYH